MELTTNFSDFLRNIRPSAAQDNAAADAQKLLRERLSSFSELSSDIVSTFLQGSYRRATDIKPVGEKKSDVDIIVVTTMHEKQYTAAQALNRFIPFLEKYYKGNYEPQGRSWGIIDGAVELDLVPTSAPSEAVMKSYASLRESEYAVTVGLGSYAELRKTAALAESDAWKKEPLRIPDRDKSRWRDTHPIAQIEWTQDKNSRTDGRYVDVVRAFKWWRMRTTPDTHPKSYPLEALIGSVCPDGISGIADGFVLSAESLLKTYAKDYAAQKVPTVCDVGVQNQNVLARVEPMEWIAFYESVAQMARVARYALDDSDRNSSIKRWQSIFGPEFPGNDDGGGTKQYFQSPSGPASVTPGRFA